MSDGSEFQTMAHCGDATPKPLEVKVVQTRGTDNRLALLLAERRERVFVVTFQ